MTKARRPKPEEPSRASLREIPERSFQHAIRGKYASRYARGTNLVLLDSDVAEAFPDAASVNEALRAVMALRRVTVGRAPRSPKPSRAATHVK
jgi:hypothetical protein